MSNREKTTEMFLAAQGYDSGLITQAIAVLAGKKPEVNDLSGPVLTPKELCQVLRISLTTLWRLNPPHMIVGCRKRYRIAEVREFVDHRQKGKGGISLGRDVA